VAWKFWKKKPPTGEPPKVEQLGRPKNIPEPLVRYLVVKLDKNPDWVWPLSGVVRLRQEGKDSYDVRLFNEAEAAAKKVNVKDYTSLDEHPELILFQGWFDKKCMSVQIEGKERPKSIPRTA
jgi:hypothetical protein